MGLFIAIEGGDGSGKGTQTKLLVKTLQAQGKDVLQLSFPRYGQESAYFVEQYLNGKYGPGTVEVEIKDSGIDDVPAELGSLPYALDRFAARSEIETQLAKPDGIIISDRYMASNLAHQGAKIDDIDERQVFYDRLMLTEYEILGIQRPDLNIVLLVPSDIAQANVDKKDARR